MSSECDVGASKAVVNGLAPGSNGQDRGSFHSRAVPSRWLTVAFILQEPGIQSSLLGLSFSDTDPTKICTGKGAVTLRASSSYREIPSGSPVSPRETPQEERKPVLESENSSAGMVSLASFLSLPSTRNPSIRGEPGSVPVSEGFLFFFHLSDEWRLPSNADANGNAQPSPLVAKGYRSVHPNLPSDKPQVGGRPRPPGTRSSFKDSLYLSSPKPYVPPGTPSQQSPSRPRPISVPLAARSAPRDDFIPPHLQRRSHHRQPASTPGSLPPVSQTPPSFSPPPPLAPPVPEGLRRISEPGLTGAVSSTDSSPLLNEVSSSHVGTDSQTFAPVSKPSSAYPSTTIVNPTIVLLQHNRGKGSSRSTPPPAGWNQP
ncbi:hypothetical protein J1605_021854 [Eschrichtius robustus]|uniref:Uncharacterized protein n=1 Tax=Eschrichtius robustus TaxID=9764 RepID=A0AB34HD49_ESCRO|nr:hypothetical protein J1605_021854 [Eschrichtius robustus]